MIEESRIEQDMNVVFKQKNSGKYRNIEYKNDCFRPQIKGLKHKKRIDAFLENRSLYFQDIRELIDNEVLEGYRLISPLNHCYTINHGADRTYFRFAHIPRF